MSDGAGPRWSIGTIGFSYPEWSATLYAGLPAGVHRLTRYAAHFNAVEINTTFYGVPLADAVRAWAGATPAGFRFCIKMPREVTHGPTPPGSSASGDGPPPGHLLEAGTLDLARRLIDSLGPLGDKLGAVLVQFPPRFTADRLPELAEFLDRLGSAAPLAVELRHTGWWMPETAPMLRERGVCRVATDDSPEELAAAAPAEGPRGAGRPRSITPTADFLYVRWLGRRGQFPDRRGEHLDPTARLEWWAGRLRGILARRPEVRRIYGFFDNDFAGHSPHTARRFAGMVGLPTPEIGVPGPEEPTLFG